MSDAITKALDDFERKERGIPQAHMAAQLVAELRAALSQAGQGGQGERKGSVAFGLVRTLTAEKNKLNTALELACSHLTDEQVEAVKNAMPDDEQAYAAKPAQAGEVTDEQIDAATRHIYHNGRPTTKEYRVGIVRAILPLRPQPAPVPAPVASVASVASVAGQEVTLYASPRQLAAAMRGELLGMDTDSYRAGDFGAYLPVRHIPGGKFTQPITHAAQQPAPAVPAGWQLVPVNPDQVMRDAGNKTLNMLAKEPGMTIADRAFYVWGAMLSAAPKPAGKDV